MKNELTPEQAWEEGGMGLRGNGEGCAVEETNEEEVGCFIYSDEL